MKKINDANTLTLSKSEMKDYGYRVVDVIVEHFDNQNSKSPVVNASREKMDALFSENIPEKGTEASKVLEFVVDKVLSQSNIPSHPKFYSFVPGPSNYISAMADTLATGFNVFSGGWAASPAAAEIEIVTINWLLKLFKFPNKKGGGLFTSGGSMANLTALVTARRQKCRDDFSNAVIYMSNQTHSSNIKALKTIGFKKEQVRVVPTDLDFKISINKLKNAIAIDKIRGFNPFCIIANAGATSTGLFDKLEDVADFCEKHALWFHVDGAHGAAALLSEKDKHKVKGIERADSLIWDAHKMMRVPALMKWVVC